MWGEFYNNVYDKFAVLKLFTHNILIKLNDTIRHETLRIECFRHYNAFNKDKTM